MSSGGTETAKVERLKWILLCLFWEATNPPPWRESSLNACFLPLQVLEFVTAWMLLYGYIGLYDLSKNVFAMWPLVLLIVIQLKFYSRNKTELIQS